MNEDIKRYMSLLEGKVEEAKPTKFSNLLESEEESAPVEETVSIAEELEAMMEMDYHEDLADVQSSLDTGIGMVKDALMRIVDKVEDFQETIEQADGHLTYAYHDVEIPQSPNEIAMKLKVVAAKTALANASNEMRKVFDHLTSIGMSFDGDINPEG